MKTICAVLGVALGLGGAPPLLAEHQLALRGVVNVPGQQMACLQVDGESWVVQAGEHFSGGSGRNAFSFEVVAVDVTNEVVQTRIADQIFTNCLPVPDRAGAQTWIHLQDANFRTAMDLLARLGGRVNLIHPFVSTDPISCAATWTNAAPGKAELAASFAKPLAARDAVVLEDGDCFLQIIPEVIAKEASLKANDLPVEAGAPGMMDFENVSQAQAIAIYAKLVDRTCQNPEAVSGRFPNFRTTRALSKPQVIYALETLLRWSGWDPVTNADKTFRLNKVNG